MKKNSKATLENATNSPLKIDSSNNGEYSIEIQKLYDMIKEKESELDKAFKARTLYLDEIEKLKLNISELTKIHTTKTIEEYEDPIPNSPQVNIKKKETEKRLQDTEIQLLESENKKERLKAEMDELKSRLNKLNFDHENLKAQNKDEIEALKAKIEILQKTNSNLNKANKRASALPETSSTNSDSNAEREEELDTLKAEFNKMKENNVAYRDEMKKMKDMMEMTNLKNQKLKNHNHTLLEIQNQFEILKATLERQSIRIGETHNRSSIFSFLSPRSSSGSISGSRSGTLRSEIQSTTITPTSSNNQMNSSGYTSSGSDIMTIKRSNGSRRTLLSELQQGFYEDFTTQDEILMLPINNEKSEVENKKHRNVIIRTLRYIYNLLYKWAKFLFLVFLSVAVAIYRGPDSQLDYF